MFERYTEQARRVIFFARYEASTYASETIGTEHLLLGFLREDRALARKLFPGQSLSGFTREIRKELDQCRGPKEAVATSVEIPLADDSKKVLTMAMESAERLGHRVVAPVHLLIGMLRTENCGAAHLLAAQGLAGRSDEDLADLSRDSYPASRNAPDAGDAMSALESFLEGIRSMGSGALIGFFSDKAWFVDATGKLWNHEEIERNFEALLAPYAKKNATYTVEKNVADRPGLFIATVLWKNALIASLERSWMHRMSITMVAEGDGWSIVLLHITAILPPA